MQLFVVSGSSGITVVLHVLPASLTTLKHVFKMFANFFSLRIWVSSHFFEYEMRESSFKRRVPPGFVFFQIVCTFVTV